MPVRRALGTSLALAAALAVPGTIVHAWLGHIDWSLTLVFGLASVPLATVGAGVALRVRERSLTMAYGIGIASLSRPACSPSPGSAVSGNVLRSGA